MVNALRKRRKQWAVNLKGGSCQDCGYNKCLAALTFHHTVERNKLFEINKAFTMTWKRIEKELDKTILLCANCHAERHWPDNKVV